MYAVCMENSSLTYCKDMVRKMDYARYLQCAFAPEAIPYYALVAELKHIHDHVSEEMIGHIRYAWWQEAVEALGSGSPRQHPVILSLAASGISKTLLVKLVESYREAWPELPQNPPELAVDNPRWQKAGRIIANHKGAKWQLAFKLLFV